MPAGIFSGFLRILFRGVISRGGGVCISFSPAEGQKNGSVGSLNSERLVNGIEFWLREEVGNLSASTLPISSGSISILKLSEIFQKSGLLFSELKILN
jgi:hypothetical protein